MSTSSLLLRLPHALLKMLFEWIDWRDALTLISVCKQTVAWTLEYHDDNDIDTNNNHQNNHKNQNQQLPRKADNGIQQAFRHYLNVQWKVTAEEMDKCYERRTIYGRKKCTNNHHNDDDNNNNNNNNDDDDDDEKLEEMWKKHDYVALFKTIARQYAGFEDIYAEMVELASRMKKVVEKVCGNAIMKSLQPTITTKQMRAQREIVPKQLLLWYRVFANGQHQQLETPTHALFGTIKFYEFRAAIRMTSMEEAVESVEMQTPGKAIIGTNVFRYRPIAIAVKCDDSSVWRGERLVASSFIIFIRSFVEQLEKKQLVFQSYEGISRFPVSGVPGMSVTDTDFIRITASPLYVPEFHSQQYLFAYRVTIAHNGSSNQSGRLLTRSWFIQDGPEDSEIETVHGEGVVGYNPHISPDCRPFVYESVCPLVSGFGTMYGHLDFAVDGYPDTILSALVGKFILSCTNTPT